MKNAIGAVRRARFGGVIALTIGMAVALLLPSMAHGDTRVAQQIKRHFEQGTAEWRLGRIASATTHLQAAADLCITPPDSYASDSGPVFFALAQLYETAGRYTEAERNYLIALSIISRVMPEHSIEVIKTLGKIAGFYTLMGCASFGNRSARLTRPVHSPYCHTWLFPGREPVVGQRDPGGEKDHTARFGTAEKRRFCFNAPRAETAYS